MFGIEEIGFSLQSLCIAFVAGFLALWDVEPVEKEKGWILPKSTFAPAVALPRGDFRVSIRKREVPLDGKQTGA